MLRRDFLARLAGGWAGATLLGNGTPWADAAPASGASNPSAPRERIAISTWSLHSYFRATRHPDFHFPGAMITLPEFPGIIVEKYGVRHLEFCAVHFDSTGPEYLRTIKNELARTQSDVVNLLLDIKECGRQGTFSDPEPQKRAIAVDALKHWVDVAHELGARSVRVDPGGADPGNFGPTVLAYNAVAAYAESRGIGVIVENVHDFGTRHPEDIIRLIELVRPVRIGALPDFANFPDAATREKGLEMLFPFARTVCHAKGQVYDAQGAELTFDFPSAMGIAHQAGFRGFFSIEFNGPGDPYAGIYNTLKELDRYIG